MSQTETLNLIRKLVIISLFADDYLRNIFVLKGGNLISLIYGLENRASIDIDVSMAKDFDQDELENIRHKLEVAFKNIFDDYNYEVFDLKLEPKPATPYEKIKDFWGGYHLEFKIINKEKASALSLELKRKQALAVGPKNSTKFKVDISKFEYCEPKEEKDFEGFTIYIYPPLLVVFEKLRAICQQIPAYSETVRLSPRTRARDFFDIHTIMTSFDLQEKILLPEGRKNLTAVFEAKKVPINLLFEISNYKSFHEDDFNSVKNTVADQKGLKDFTFYFDYVVALTQSLKSSGME